MLLAFSRGSYFNLSFLHNLLVRGLYKKETALFFPWQNRTQLVSSGWGGVGKTPNKQEYSEKEVTHLVLE